jgi:flagellar protein FliS
LGRATLKSGADSADSQSGATLSAENYLGYGNQAQEYRKNAVLSASPAQLVVMLYDGALRFIEAGRIAMKAKDIKGQNDALLRAQKIVVELLSTLDREKGGEIATNLATLYTFVLDQLMEANVHDRPAALDNASKTMSELREAWVHIAATTTRTETREIKIAA